MTVNQKVTGTAASIPAGLLLGGLSSMAITLAGAALTAWMALRGVIPEEGIGYCAMVILLLSAASGSGMAIAKVKRLRAQIGLAAGGIYYLCLVCIGALFFGGVTQGMGVTALMVLCGSALVILLGPGGQNRAGCRKRKKRY